jgi:hypothetical protein
MSHGGIRGGGASGHGAVHTTRPLVFLFIFDAPISNQAPLAMENDSFVRPPKKVSIKRGVRW